MKHSVCKPGDHLSLALLSWLHILLLFGCSYLVAAAFLELSAKASLACLANSLWLLAPAALSWVFIRRIPSLILYLLFSGAVCALVWKCSGSAQTAAISGAIFVLRCYARLKRGRIRRLMKEMPGELGAQLSKDLWEIPTFLDEPSPVCWAVFAVCYLIILFTGRQDLLHWTFLLLLADVFVCFFHCYLRRMWNFIKENQRIANLPVRTIQKVGKIVLVIAAILLTLLVLPSVLYGREPLADLIGNMQERPAAPPAEMPEDLFERFGGDMVPPIPAEDYGEPPVWLTVFTDVLMYGAAAAGALLLLLFIYRLCRSAAHYFAQDCDDEIVFLNEDSEQSGPGKAAARRAKKERRNSPNRKIRRFYKKTLQRSLTQQPAGWETPAELEQSAQLASDQQTALLHTLYEKARYSQTGCAATDAERLLSEFRPSPTANK